MKKRILSVVAVFALTGTMAFGQLKIYNSELLKIGNVNETPDITTGFEVSMPNIYLKSDSFGMKFSNSKFRIGDVASMNSLSPGFEVAMPAVRMGTGSVGLSIEATQVLLGKISSSSTSFKSYFQLLPAEAWIGLDRGIVRLSILRDVQYVPKSGVIDGGGNIGGLESIGERI